MKMTKTSKSRLFVKYMFKLDMFKNKPIVFLHIKKQLT